MSSAFTPVSTSHQVTAYQYEFVKTFLYNIHSKKSVDNELIVNRMLGYVGRCVTMPTPVCVTDDPKLGMNRIIDETLSLTISYKSHEYELMLFVTYNDPRERIHMMHLLGLDEEAKECSLLQEYILLQAIRSSPMNGKTLQVSEEDTPGWLEDTKEVNSEIIELEETTLNDVFLPAKLQDSLRLFIHSVKNYSTLQKPLRFLFSGKPGTAKTKIIRAIANECKGDATFIFTSGSERRINGIFSLAQYFSPVVLCIDDLDFMTGNREDNSHSRSLGTFLQKLDGFVQKDLFILATTNDKKLVDLAASRPGRFDMIIDVNAIEPLQYKSLVSSKTDNENIIYLFDDEVLNLLKRKKATGAFIANIVKHLELMNEYDSSKVSNEYLLELIKDTQKGFYKEAVHSNDRFGFDN